MKLYAIFDAVAGSLLGTMVMMFRRDEAAIRWFTDGLTQEGSVVAKHPEDFELRCLCGISDDGVIDGQAPSGPRVVLTGKQWLAMQPETPAKLEAVS